jgi:hypothetical protein
MIITYQSTDPAFFDTPAITLEKILQVLNGGGTGGGGSGSAQSVTSGTVDPTTAPSNTAIAHWYVNTSADTGWVWPEGGSAWEQIV